MTVPCKPDPKVPWCPKYRAPSCTERTLALRFSSHPHLRGLALTPAS